MHTRFRWWWTALVAGILALGLAGVVRADDDKATDFRGIAGVALDAADAADHKALNKQVYDVLREIHNEGAALYNNGDHAACYYMFVGALRAIRPLLGHLPEVQKDIETGMAKADRHPAIHRRAFALHEVIEGVRAKVNPSPKKPAEKKPPQTKPAEKKPAEKKPAETKPAEKPADKKPAADKTGRKETGRQETRGQETRREEARG